MPYPMIQNLIKICQWFQDSATDGKGTGLNLCGFLSVLSEKKSKTQLGGM